MAAYDAFISYSHAKDKPIAAALQSVVQTLGKPWYRRRSLRLFRDDTSLSATPHLWPSIELALGQSRFLILIASAEAAASSWVGKEVTYWLAHKSIDTLLIAVTDGELSWDPTAADFAWSPATPLPAVLKGRFAAEPKWVDLRPYRDGATRHDTKFTDLSADFAAAVQGVPKEDLLSEEVRQQRRALTLAWSAVGLLIMLAGAAGWQWKAALDAERIAVDAQRIAEEQRTEAQTQRDSAQQQRDRAERTLTAATDTANGLVFDLAVKFREVRGIQLDIVQGILDRAKGLLDQLVSFNETSPSIQLNRVTSWSELGFTLAQQGSPQGAALVTEAYKIATGLAHDHPELDGLDYATGRAAEVLAQMHERDDPKAAVALNQEAQAAFAKCFDAHPKDIECLKHEFTAVGRLGNMFFDSHQYTEALTIYQKSLDLALIYERMVPPGPEVGLHIAGRHNHFGRTYFQMRNPDDALREFKLAQTALEPWAGQPQASSTFLLELSSTYNNIGSTLSSQIKTKSDKGKMQEAIGYTERATKLLEGLAASDPSNLFYWSNLAADYDNLEYLNGLIGNRSEQDAYGRRRQQAMDKAKTAGPSPVAQSPVAQSPLAQTPSPRP